MTTPVSNCSHTDLGDWLRTSCGCGYGPGRLAELRAALEAERISYGELMEIQDAFELIDPATLPEPAENAMASDMLDEIEQRIDTKEGKA